MQLAGVILTPDETREVISQHFPETRHSLERSFKFYNPEKDPIQSANALLIVALCCPDAGIEFDKLISMVGIVNAPLVGQLISSELISLRDGRLHLSSSYYFSPDPTRVIRWIKYAADLFDFHNADKEGQFSCFRIEGLNENGFHEVRDLFVQTEKALEAILKDPSKRGEHSLSMALFTTLNGK
ncbi:MAG: hypothetical protein M3Q07_09315 [Pseudobdellovibrionaceae bacterium]|nr:hypothetical protein [Pseudobdellovibrionaceae bacterium]